jgi:hypothetical protein
MAHFDRPKHTPGFEAGDSIRAKVEMMADAARSLSMTIPQFFDDAKPQSALAAGCDDYSPRAASFVHSVAIGGTLIPAQ